MKSSFRPQSAAFDWWMPNQTPATADERHEPPEPVGFGRGGDVLRQARRAHDGGEEGQRLLPRGHRAVDAEREAGRRRRERGRRQQDAALGPTAIQTAATRSDGGEHEELQLAHDHAVRSRRRRSARMGRMAQPARTGRVGPVRPHMSCGRVSPYQRPHELQCRALLSAGSTNKERREVRRTGPRHLASAVLAARRCSCWRPSWCSSRCRCATRATRPRP